MPVFCFFLLLFISQSSLARVFDFKKESFAAYIGGSYVPTVTENTMLSDSSGTDVTLDANYTNVSSFEFGFVYGSEIINTRIGFELIRPPDIKDRMGTDAAGTELYSLTSETAIFVPKLSFEVAIKTWQRQRFLLLLGAGSASLTGRNSYVLTDAGTTALAPVTEHYEDLRATALLYEGGLAFEGVLSDTTTYMLSAGYRSLNFKEIKQNRDVTAFSGTVVKGDKALNMDGTDRVLNLSQVYYGIAFRFWVY